MISSHSEIQMLVNLSNFYGEIVPSNLPHDNSPFMTFAKYTRLHLFIDIDIDSYISYNLDAKQGRSTVIDEYFSLRWCFISYGSYRQY